MVDLYFLVFIHLASRQIWNSPCTANPTGEWTTQQARSFDMFLQAFVVRVIQTLKHEVLNAFCVVSERHLDHILRVSQDWYNQQKLETQSAFAFAAALISD